VLSRSGVQRGLAAMDSSVVNGTGDTAGGASSGRA
jgi:hypothetical protein